MPIRLARTALLRLLAVMLAFVLIAAACGGGDDDSAGDVATDSGDDSADDSDSDDADDGDDEQSATPTVTVAEPEPEDTGPVSGGTLRVAVEAETDGLNPVANNFAVSAYLMAFTMIEPVAYYDQDGNWFPWLAESFTPIEGTSSWQMKLREGIKFHDGSELDADDIIANFNGQLTDPLISLAVRPNFPEENQIEKIDDYTVQYNLIRPSAHFPVNLTSQLGMVVPSEYVAAAAENGELHQQPIGTGPYMLESRTQDDVTVVVKNPDYWAGTDNVYLDRIEFHIVTDTAIAAERVAAGDLDVVITSNPDAILTLQDAAGVTAHQNLLSGENDIMMNTRKAPFDDIRARQALTFAADREGYASLIGQGTSPLADSMFHPELDWNNPDVVQEGNMPDRAGPLVTDYCADNPDNCTDGKINIELQYSGPSVTQTRIADLLTAGWEPYFNITEQELLQDQHIIEVALGMYDVVTWRQFGAVDPDNEVVWLECATAEGGITLNWVRVCNPDRDALLFEQRATDDRDRRIEIWQQIQQEMNETYAYIFTTHANWTVGVSDKVRNICGQTSPEATGSMVLNCNNQGRYFFHGVWLAE